MPLSVLDGAVALPSVSPEGVSRLRWGPAASPLLAVASWDKRVQLWSVPAGVPADKGLFVVPGPLLDLCWSPDGRTIYGASADASVISIDAERGTVSDLGFHGGPARTVHWSDAIGAVVSGGWDGFVRVSDPRSPATAAKPVALGSRVHASDLSGESGTLVVATADLRVHLYDVRRLDEPLRIAASGLTQQLRSVRFFPGGTLYALTAIEGRCGIRCVSADAEEELNAAGKPKHAFTFKCHREGDKVFAVHCAETHPGRADVFATCGGDGTVSIWEKNKRIRLREYKMPRLFGASEPLTQVAWDAAGELLAVAEGYDWAYGQRDGKGSTPRVLLAPTGHDVLDKQ